MMVEPSPEKPASKGKTAAFVQRRAYPFSLKLIDRYLLRQIVRPFVIILAVIVAVLFLENLSRLLQLLEHVRSPLPILGRFTLFLLPEYLGLGVLVALFLAVAWAVRSATLRGEWQIFATIGVTPIRLAFVPLALGLLGASAELAINFHFRPIGEHRLDRLIGDLRDGRYGLGGDVGTILHLGQGVTMTVDRFDPSAARFFNIFIAQGTTILTARSAQSSFDDDGQLNLLLEQGQSLTPRPSGGFHVLSFGRLRINLATRERQAARQGLEPELDRLSYQQLLDRVRTESGQNRPSRLALASFASRCGYAAMAIMMPVFGLALGAMPPRSRSGYGIGFGILLIVAYVRASGFVETQFAGAPVAAFVALLAVFSILAIALWEAERRFGPGFAEGWLERRLAAPAARQYARFTNRRRDDSDNERERLSRP